ncbi:hypothetical protein SAMN05661099_1680 [Daejeonella lutea]|uniref:Uncharacterized protein n=1 Tax=Daejeonella lutea TaxID=572036 RepID=A0A1T5BTJ3_9SPHI|nr:hypothetical protein SAMN05661099_1680 [Daejeonella lutea]
MLPCLINTILFECTKQQTKQVNFRGFGFKEARHGFEVSIV